jgi:hypothetical protein
MSHKKSLSSSLSLNRWGSKCQNSCNASNLCFFYVSDSKLSRNTSGSPFNCEAGRNPNSSSSSTVSCSLVKSSFSTTTPFPLQGQSRRSWVSQADSRYEKRFLSSSKEKLLPLDPLPSCRQFISTLSLP